MEYDLVFEGGGAKGTVFVGAVQELEARGHTPARLLGASAGAIMATFLAAGYTSQEMGRALSEAQEDGQPVFLGFLEKPPKLTREELKDSAIRELLRSTNNKLLPDFLEDRLDDALSDLLVSSPITGRLCSFIELGGFFAADNFIEWLENKLNAGVYTPDRGQFGKDKPRAFGNMNLAQFHEATGTELSLIASDTTASRMLVLNHHTAPDCPLKWAVRMSMSVPLLWYEVVWQSEWGRYMGIELTGDTIVDGGLLSNFPIELFLSNEEQVTRVMGEKTEAGVPVLGFLIDESLDVPAAPAVQKAASRFDFASFKTVRRVANLINTMTQAHDKLAIEAYQNFVVRLPARGYGTIEFGMSEERRNALVNAGRAATQEYFNRMDSRSLEAADEDIPIFDMADRIAARILDF
jgi:predicted acylesterase/phospholipase RssA